MTTTRRRWMIVGGVLLLLLGAVAVVSLSLPDELDEYVARLEAEGEPVTFGQVVAPAWDPDENAAAELLTIFEELIADVDAGPGTVSTDVLKPLGGLAPAERELITTQVARHEPTLDRIREIVLARRFRFDTRALAQGGPAWTAGQRGLMETHCLLRRAGDLHLAASDADPEAHLRTIETLCALGAAWEPVTLIDLSILGGPDHGAAEQVRRALAAGRLDPVAAHARLEPLLRRSRVASWGLAQRAVRVCWLDSYEGLLGRGSERVPRAWRWVPPGTTLDWSERLVLQSSVDLKFSLLDSVVAVDATNSKSARDSMDAVAAGFRDTRWWGGSKARIDPKGDSSYLDRFIRADTELHLARIALAAGAHRANTGEWPAAVSELVPLLGGEEPLDVKGLPYTLSVTPDGDLTLGGTVPAGGGVLADWRLPR